MKKAIYLLLFIFIQLNLLTAQQERQYSQFMYNKLTVNPAFAGATPHFALNGLYRNQWLGIVGAPVTELISANIPLMEQRVGLGANLIHNSIGISEMWTLSAMYAYRLPVGDGFISGGMEGSLRYYGADYSDPRLIADNDLSVDQAVIEDNVSKYVPNIGLGLYYSNPQFYLGISAPRLISSNIDFKDNLLISREVIHIYGMMGYSFLLQDNVSLTPQVMLKYAKNSPLSIDANIMADFDTRLTAGISYRSGNVNNPVGESIDLLLGFKILPPVFVGLAYDIPMGEIGKYNKGSLEIMLRYMLPDESSEDIQNPRFF